MRLETKEKNRIVVLLEDTEDLWFASKIITAGSIVRGRGTRKVAAGEKDVAKKTYVFELDAERVELQPTGLRVLGTVRNELDDVPKASHQSILFQPGDRLEITREWDVLTRKRLEHALERVSHRYLVVFFDRDSAVVSEVSGRGSREIERLSGDVARKDYDVQSEDFFARVLRESERIAQRGYAAVILAGSSIWIDEMKKRETTLSARYVEVSSVDSSSIRTLLERREIASELSALSGMQEVSLVEELLKRISTGSKYAYGFSDVEKAIGFGAVETVLISQRAIDKAFENETFDRIKVLMESADAIQARIEIIESERDAMLKLDGLGGIGALLRYDIE